MTRSNGILRIAAAVGVAGGITGAALAAAAFALAGHVVKSVTSPSPRTTRGKTEFTPFETGVDWEEVAIPGAGGSELPGWLFKRTADAPAILACGGYRGRRSDLLGISSSLWRAGFNVLLFDYRGHGDTAGPVTLGFQETEDARAALAYLRARLPAAPLGVIGFSMGASVAIMLAARDRGDERKRGVEAVVADSPFTSQHEILGYRLARRMSKRTPQRVGMVGQMILALADRRLASRFGFRMADVHPLNDVTAIAPRPLLLIHGEEDEIIPVEHATHMSDAARRAGVAIETWLVPGAWHCGAYFLDRKGYCARVASFFSGALGSP